MRVSKIYWISYHIKNMKIIRDPEQFSNVMNFNWRGLIQLVRNILLNNVNLVLLYSFDDSLTQFKRKKNMLELWIFCSFFLKSYKSFLEELGLIFMYLSLKRMAYLFYVIEKISPKYSHFSYEYLFLQICCFYVIVAVASLHWCVFNYTRWIDAQWEEKFILKGSLFWCFMKFVRCVFD